MGWEERCKVLAGRTRRCIEHVEGREGGEGGAGVHDWLGEGEGGDKEPGKTNYTGETLAGEEEGRFWEAAQHTSPPGSSILSPSTMLRLKRDWMDGFWDRCNELHIYRPAETRMYGKKGWEDDRYGRRKCMWVVWWLWDWERTQISQFTHYHSCFLPPPPLKIVSLPLVVRGTPYKDPTVSCIKVLQLLDCQLNIVVFQLLNISQSTSRPADFSRDTVFSTTTDSCTEGLDSVPSQALVFNFYITALFFIYFFLLSNPCFNNIMSRGALVWVK